jgi:hypothetical protein
MLMSDIHPVSAFRKFAVQYHLFLVTFLDIDMECTLVFEPILETVGVEFFFPSASFLALTGSGICTHPCVTW